MTRPTNPLIHSVQSLTGGGGVPTVEARQAMADALIAPMLGHRTQREVVAWIGRVASHGAGRATARNLCAHGPRRSGKSTIAVALAYLMIVLDDFVVRMLTATLRAPTTNILESAGDGGLLRRLRDVGLGQWLDIDRAAGSVVAVAFPWGSVLHVHDVGSARAIKKHHGFAGRVFWADEAQNIELLHYCLANLVAPTLSDSYGLVLLTGTPGDQTGSLYHRVSTGRDSSYDRVGLRTWHNPRLGATPTERWQRVCDTSIALAKAQYSISESDFARLRALTEHDLDSIADGCAEQELQEWVNGLDAELRRQMFGLWVTDGAAHVFAWHRVSAAQLYYCRTAAHIDPALPVAVTLADRVALLPDTDHDAQPLIGKWRAAIAFDIGRRPDPCALVIMAWHEDWPIAYEVWSAKRFDLSDSGMLAKLTDGVDMAVSAGLLVSGVIADAGGMREGTRVEWDTILSQRYHDLGVSVRAPRKSPNYKDSRTKALNIDIEQGRIQFVAGSELDAEGLHLRYTHNKPEDGPAKVDKHRIVHQADGTTIMPGNDCCDCMLYLAEDIGHMLCDLNPSHPASESLTPVQSAHSSWMDSQLGGDL